MRSVSAVRVTARWFCLPVLFAVFALAAPTPPASLPPSRDTIAGKWNIANGVFVFYRTKAKNTFTDKVIEQRPGVFCPRVNDRSGQMVLHHRRGDVYTGTWTWYYVANCKFAGYGRLTVTLWWQHRRATFFSTPPAGLRATPPMFYIDRLG
jgi:hypothetical protein